MNFKELRENGKEIIKASFIGLSVILALMLFITVAYQLNQSDLLYSVMIGLTVVSLINIFVIVIFGLIFHLNNCKEVKY